MITPDFTATDSKTNSAGFNRSILRTRTSEEMALRTLPLRKQVTFADTAQRGPLQTVFEVEKLVYAVPVSKGSCCALL